jgi:hypothetical protein
MTTHHHCSVSFRHKINQQKQNKIFFSLEFPFTTIFSCFHFPATFVWIFWTTSLLQNLLLYYTLFYFISLAFLIYYTSVILLFGSTYTVFLVLNNDEKSVKARKKKSKILNVLPIHTYIQK